MNRSEPKYTPVSEIIMSKIYVLRGQKVMLDKDLAELFQVETKQLKRQVNRNIQRFPSDFMFELSELEFANLRSQFGTSSWGGTRYLPYAITEHGILMLSSVLNSDRAIAANIQIMRVFTQLRKMLTDNMELRTAFEDLRKKTENNTKNIELVFQYIDELSGAKKKSRSTKSIGFKIPRRKKI